MFFLYRDDAFKIQSRALRAFRRWNAVFVPSAPPVNSVHQLLPLGKPQLLEPFDLSLPSRKSCGSACKSGAVHRNNRAWLPIRLWNTGDIARNGMLWSFRVPSEAKLEDALKVVDPLRLWINSALSIFFPVIALKRST
jgi:hypothetical protein